MIVVMKETLEQWLLDLQVIIGMIEIIIKWTSAWRYLYIGINEHGIDKISKYLICELLR